MTRRAQSLFLSLDFIMSAIIAVCIAIFIPSKIEVGIAKEIFNVAIAVLSIVFSVYFAAMAVVISAGDDKFVSFLEEDGSYSHIIWTFKVTLLLLFSALILSIILFTIVLPFKDAPLPDRYFPTLGIALFSWLSLWSLFAAAQVTLDAIKYSQYRVRFIQIMRGKDDD